MTLSRRLPLMKTARFLAGLPDICAHPGIGAARDKSPDPLSPLSHSSGASAAAIGDESPSRLSLRVRHFKANIPRDVNAIHDAAFNEVESVIERTTLLRSQKDALI